jgi:hypothetical protein
MTSDEHSVLPPLRRTGVAFMVLLLATWSSGCFAPEDAAVEVLTQPGEVRRSDANTHFRFRGDLRTYEQVLQPPVGRITLFQPEVLDGLVGRIRVEGSFVVERRTREFLVFTCQERDRRGRRVGGGDFTVSIPPGAPDTVWVDERILGVPRAAPTTDDGEEVGVSWRPVPGDKYPVRIEWQVNTDQGGRWKSVGDANLVCSGEVRVRRGAEIRSYTVDLTPSDLGRLYDLPVPEYQVIIRASPVNWSRDEYHPRSETAVAEVLRSPITREQIARALERLDS